MSLIALVLLLPCSALEPRSLTINSMTRDEKQLHDELLSADRLFAKATAERGLKGWMEFMADDVARLEKVGGKFIKGSAAVRKSDAALFADSKRQLVWEPVDAHVYADQQSGLTSGRYRVIGKDADGKEVVYSKGGYFTGWRKQSNGLWKVTFDGGSPDVPATK